MRYGVRVLLRAPTKYVNRAMLGWDHGGRTRIRFSLMPADLAKSIDVRTSPVAERMAAITDFVDAGYEVHVTQGVQRNHYRRRLGQLVGTQ